MQKEMLANIDLSHEIIENKPTKRALSLSPNLKIHELREGQIPLLSKSTHHIVQNFKEFDKKYSILFIRNTIKSSQSNERARKFMKNVGSPEHKWLRSLYMLLN